MLMVRKCHHTPILHMLLNSTPINSPFNCLGILWNYYFNCYITSVARGPRQNLTLVVLTADQYFQINGSCCKDHSVLCSVLVRSRCTRTINNYIYIINVVHFYRPTSVHWMAKSTPTCNTINIFSVGLIREKMCAALLVCPPIILVKTELTYTVTSWSVPHKEVLDISSLETYYLVVNRLCLLLNLSAWVVKLRFRNKIWKVAFLLHVV